MSFKGSGRTAFVTETEKPKITAWSFSRYKTYTQCPAKAKYGIIDRLQEPENEKQLEGKRIHKLAEDYLNGLIDDVPEELGLFALDYAALRDEGREHPDSLFPEKQVAFDQNYKQLDWFSKAAWLRCRYDALLISREDAYALVVDLKTGKPYKEDREQMSLFAEAIFIEYPEINEVRTELWYSKTGAVEGHTFFREELDTLKAEWAKKSAPMLADEEFLPTPNRWCPWCHYRASNSGPCKYN